MKFETIPITGAYIIDLELIEDSRGFFARSFCKNEFAETGIDFDCLQCNISFNNDSGTFRGLHSQAAPYEEAKIVRCSRGKLLDIILDLRKDSPSYKKHFTVELSGVNRRMLYVPKGVYHGFITLENDTEIFYMMSQFYHADKALGVRYDDPAFNIELPVEIEVISDKDKSYPDYHEQN